MKPQIHNLIGHIWRLAVLALLALVALVGILSAPLEGSPTWLTDFLISKAIGFAAGGLMYWLFCRWNARGYKLD